MNETHHESQIATLQSQLDDYRRFVQQARAIVSDAEVCKLGVQFESYSAEIIAIRILELEVPVQCVDGP